MEIISIIIPIYNVIEYLKRCVYSVCKQTFENLEIILIDDGSTDGSGKLCDELASEDKRIVVIHQENGGSTSARNAGLKLATGDYIGFVDSDDYIEPDMYETLYEAIKKVDADICVGRQYIDKNGINYVEKGRSITEGIIKKESGIIADNIIYTNDMSNKGISPNLWDKLFKKELIMKHQLRVDKNTKYAEDDLCVYSCLLEADKIVFVNKPIYHYCTREGSVTQSGDDLYFSKINLFYKQMKDVFTKHQQSEILINKLNHYMVELVIRGLNGKANLGFGSIIPYHIPPYSELIMRGAKRIVIYGAGDMTAD